MCARVCPTETLCEEACVREVAEGKPVQIGRLQRYATDVAMAAGQAVLHRAPHRPARRSPWSAPARPALPPRIGWRRHGHDVTIFEARPKAGGLNEYGIAAYKSADDFAQAEVDYVTAIGGIDIENGKALGRDFQLADLIAELRCGVPRHGAWRRQRAARRWRGRRRRRRMPSSSSPSCARPAISRACRSAGASSSSAAA